MESSSFGVIVPMHERGLRAIRSFCDSEERRAIVDHHIRKLINEIGMNWKAFTSDTNHVLVFDPEGKPTYNNLGTGIPVKFLGTDEVKLLKDSLLPAWNSGLMQTIQGFRTHLEISLSQENPRIDRGFVFSHFHLCVEHYRSYLDALVDLRGGYQRAYSMTLIEAQDAHARLLTLTLEVFELPSFNYLSRQSWEGLGLGDSPDNSSYLLRFPRLDQRCRQVLHPILRACGIALQGLSQNDRDMWNYPYNLTGQIQSSCFIQTLDILAKFIQELWTATQDVQEHLTNKRNMLNDVDTVEVFREMIEHSEWKQDCF